MVAILGHAYRNEQISKLVSQSESQNAAMVQTLANTFLESYYHYIPKFHDKSPEELKQLTAIREFDKVVRSHLAKLDVHLVSVLSPQGVTILTTNPRKLASKTKDPNVLQALESERPVSNLQYQELVNSMEALKVHRHVVTSFIPLFIRGEPKVQGVVEIQLDVTDFIDSINKNTSISYLVIASIMLVFFFALYLVVRKAELFIRNLSLRINKQDKLIQNQKYHDALTGLPNRIMFRDRLDLDMKLCKLKDNLLALLFIDLDYFQKVNDALGYATGDSLLIEVSDRLKQCVRSGDTVARIGGDGAGPLCRAPSELP